MKRVVELIFWTDLHSTVVSSFFAKSNEARHNSAVQRRYAF
jgi:hypothetical protein